MKIALHFNADFESLRGGYGHLIRKTVLRAVINSRTLDLHTKVFEGDLLLSTLTMKVEKTATGETRRFDKERFHAAIQTLLSPGTHIWMTFRNESVANLLKKNVFVILFESISFRDALELDRLIGAKPYYLGALQVDETCGIHWAAYSHSLIATHRIIGKAAYSFWDGLSEDSKDHGSLEELREIGFTRVEFEALNGKYSIFDKYDDFQQARRVAELSQALSDSLAFLADQAITRLSDAAPEIGDRIWPAIRSYESAEVNEDYAQVAVSCRRVIEYVTDQLFPPQGEIVKGKKGYAKEYKNRLLAYADKERSSNASIDLICISNSLLLEQWEKLRHLVNEGVHSNLYRHEARRSLLRTLMLLDDILSLRSGPLEIKPALDLTSFLSQ